MIRNFWNSRRPRRAAAGRPAPARHRVRLSAELLEDRVVPADVFYTALTEAALVAAIDAANFGDSVRPSAALAGGPGGTIDLTASLGNVTGPTSKSLSLYGATDDWGAPKVFLDGQNAVRIFDARGNENVSFFDLGFRNGSASGTGPDGFGGAFRADHNHLVTFTNCAFAGNAATGGGGAIDFEGTGGLLTLLACQFTGNASAGSGGAVEVANSSASLVGCTFDGNQAGRAGGVDLVANDPGYPVHFLVQDAVFENNTALGTGGLAVGEQSGSSADPLVGQILGCKFLNNTSTSTLDAVGFGGGADFSAQAYSADLNGDNGSANISVGNSDSNVTEFAGNHSGRFGGGFAATASAWYGATASVVVDGGAQGLLVHDNGPTTPADPLLGGGAYLQTQTRPGTPSSAAPTVYFGVAHAEIYNNTTSDAAGSEGGGLYVSDEGMSPTGLSKVQFSSLTFHDNSTGGQGGGLYLVVRSDDAAAAQPSTFIMANVTFYANEARAAATGPALGGALFLTEAGPGPVYIFMTCLTVTRNRAASGDASGTASGGGLYLEGATPPTLHNSVFAENSSQVGAGPAAYDDVFGTALNGGYDAATSPVDGFDPGEIYSAADVALDTSPSTPGPNAQRVLVPLPGSALIAAGDPTLAGEPDETDAVRAGPTTIGAYDPNGTAPPGGRFWEGPNGADLALVLLAKKD